MLLPERVQVAGLAAGHALSFTAGLLVCAVVVRRRIGPGDPVVLRTAVRCVAAAAVPRRPGAPGRRRGGQLLGRGPGAALVALGVAGPVLAVGYALLAARLRVTEVAELAGPVVRRLKPGR